jgi:alkanesulfonate monooxygenase SsuD/methylene tetrahydromethanopterin reductase-like flavin-dependent oxidoreductase (luciferase family)
MGLTLPPPASASNASETLRLAVQMWAGDASPFHGKHYRLEHPRQLADPLTKPRPPATSG